MATMGFKSADTDTDMRFHGELCYNQFIGRRRRGVPIYTFTLIHLFHYANAIVAVCVSASLPGR